MSKKTTASPYSLPQKTFSKYRKPLAEVPNLIENHVNSYNAFLKKGFGDILKEFTPIEDYSGKKFKLDIISFEIGEAKHTEVESKRLKLTYDAPIKARFKLTNKVLGTVKEQELFVADIPLVTDHGTFITNGIERVVVAQLIRSYGVFIASEEFKGKEYFGAKVIPARGVWIEIQTEADGDIVVRLDKKRKFGAVILLRAFGFQNDEEIISSFKSDLAKQTIKELIAREEVKTVGGACVEVYRKLRDGDLATEENAQDFLKGLFSKERYDFSIVGRHRFNKRFNLSMEGKDIERKTFSKEDLAMVVEAIIEANNNPEAIADDIDHLGSRRVRFVGELIEAKIRTGMIQIKRNIQDRMSVVENEETLPTAIINQRPLQARIKEFFNVNQLSQFMIQDNILAEIEHLRRLSAMGPGGLNKDRATFEVRDVHTSHYGRVCPIQTPEGANIGLILQMSLYSRINSFGIIETPYIKVKDGKITGDMVYLNALEEETATIASSNVELDAKGNIKDEVVQARMNTLPGFAKREDVDFIDVATFQQFSAAAALIPFLEHDDANRTLMGANMQRQGVPLIKPEAPIVGTGLEAVIARDTGRLIYAPEDGIVNFVDADTIKFKGLTAKKEQTFTLQTFERTNQFTNFHQRPLVRNGDEVKKGDVLADMSTTVGGQVALGQNAMVAFMTWRGHNYEDAIVISERLVREQKFSSIHIEEFVCLVRDTKLGPETTTCDIPNVGEARLRNLDADGLVRVGAEVFAGDILVGKITPKGETELTPEERLLRSIFGEKSREVRDTSLRLEVGKKGRVIGVKIFSREKGDPMETGIIKRIHVEIAQVRNISVGDKLAGRHGNKGVISIILPEEEMPFTKDGKSVDVVLTPLGVPSRMNLGQILEMHLGLAANALGYQAIVPPFQGATMEEIQNELETAGYNRSGKMDLYDGQTGEKFQQAIAVGYMYILKLHHMVEDKLHMRSTGPYSLITQQPLGGKAQGGGQRLGEMEVWALEGYGAAYTLREMLTFKSDDIKGRAQAFDAIIKKEPMPEPGIPASFNVFKNTLRGLGLDVKLQGGDGQDFEADAKDEFLRQKGSYTEIGIDEEYGVDEGDLEGMSKDSDSINL
jgi:DNA-directed RNA polymerase subunit beta